jgi:hypothetical protein
MMEPAKPSFDRLTRKAGCIVVLSLLPLYFLVQHLGDPGRARAAFLSAGVVIVGAMVFWDFKRSVWLWVALGLMVLLHIPLVLLIPWTNKSYPGFGLLPVTFADFCIVYGCLWGFFKLFGQKRGTRGTAFHEDAG